MYNYTVQLIIGLPKLAPTTVLYKQIVLSILLGLVALAGLGALE